MASFSGRKGLRLHYEVVGDDPVQPAIVLVHGWGSDARGTWVRTGWVEALSNLRQVVLLDVRGHGRSDKPLEPDCYGYAEMSQDVLDLMDHLGLAQADYLGYSMGAFMGAWLLGHHRARFRTMTLGGVGIETDASIAAVDIIAAALRAKDPASIADPMGRAYRAFVDADPDIDRHARNALAVSALRMWPEGDAIALGGSGLAEVDVPVLLVVGGDDAPYAHTVGRYQAAVPGAQLTVMAGEDHLGTVRAEQFKAAVRALLDAT